MIQGTKGLNAIFGILLATLVLPICDGTADIIYLRNGNTIFGRVVQTNPDEVTFDQRTEASSRYRQRIIRRSEIATIVINLSGSRLETLQPSRPAGYRDLAEELAEQKRDPEARDLAIRLFLLGAAQGNASLRISCFRGVIPLARSPAEEKRLRVLAFATLDDKQEWLIPVEETGPAGNEIDIANRQDERNRLVVALQQLRRGQRSEAAKTVNETWVGGTLESFKTICSWRQLKSLALESDLSTAQLSRVVELEIALTPRPAKPDDGSLSDWAQLVDSTGSNLPISFENVSEFDLQKTIFRQGKWVAPDLR